MTQRRVRGYGVERSRRAASPVDSRPLCGRAGSSCTMVWSCPSIASGAPGRECCIGWSDNNGQASVEQEPAEGPRAPAQRHAAGQQGRESNCRDADRPRASATHTCESERRKRGIQLVASPSAWRRTAVCAGGRDKPLSSRLSLAGIACGRQPGFGNRVGVEGGGPALGAIGCV